MPDWDDDPGDGNASDYDRAMSSGDDDEDGHNTKRGNKLPRYQYPTFQGDEDDDADSIQDDEFSSLKRQKMTHEERTYGVFYTEGMSSEEEKDARHPKPIHNSKRNQKRKPFFKSSSSRAQVITAPIFVKGYVLQPKEEDQKITSQDSESNNKKTEAKDSKLQAAGSKESFSAEAESGDLDRKRRAQEADQHFLNLLKQGTTRLSTIRSPTLKREALEPKHDETENPSRPMNSGLGFRSSVEEPAPNGVGLGFRQGSLSGVGGGLGFRPAESEGAEKSFVSAGLGFGQFGSKVRESQPKQEKQPKLDPNLGKWEKHTKGIGAKLLAKMGYSGKGGLGAKRRKIGEGGIIAATAPIQVKVRPANLGLGFGGFKEATHLNKEQEAKTKQKEDKKQSEKQFPEIRKSDIPSVNELLKDESSWRSEGKKKKDDVKEKPKIVSYKELLELQKERSQNIKILDMRGPQALAEETNEVVGSESSEPPLAEELLYNVSLLIGTHESKLYSAHQMESASRQKLESMRADADSLLRQKQELRQRYDKMSSAVAIMDEIDGLDCRGKDLLPRIIPLLQRLAATFTQEERKSLKFAQVILPALLYPILNEELDQSWDPLGTSISKSEKLIRSTFDAVLPVLSLEDEGGQRKAVMSIWCKFILPRAERALKESEWVRDNDAVEKCAALYELLQHLTKEMNISWKKSASKTESEQHVLPSEEEYDDLALSNMLQKQLIHNTVHPKLLRCLSRWKPSLDDSGCGLRHHLDQIVLPWIPYLDHHGLLPTLLQDCRSKVKTALSFLQKHLEDKAFIEQAIRVVRPWRGILKSKYIEEMVSTFIAPKLARGLAKEKLVAQESKQDWELIHLLFRSRDDGLITNLEFLSIVEGELLNQWCHCMCEWVQHGGVGVECLITNHYLQWKKHLLGSEPPTNDNKFSGCQRVLRNDMVVCQLFYSILLTMKHAQSYSSGIDAPLPPTTTYRAVLSRRTTEERKKSAEELARMDVVSGGVGDSTTEARVRLAQRDHSREPTFREVVDEFANERGILFQPRLGDKASQVDGKQVFMFGSIPVYLDSNVVYAFSSDTKDWEPIALDDLGTQASYQAKSNT